MKTLHETLNTFRQSLINNGIFVCPKCGQEHKADVAYDFLVNYGLIQVIRAFKTKNDLITKETKSIAGDANDDVCLVHCKNNQ